MSVEQQLRELNDHPSDSVANWAADAYELQEDFKAGRISKSEYVELLGDLKHSKAITEAAADLDTLGQMNQILEGLTILATTV
jgi:aspartate carbamoyltransferase catalytic subunit